MNSLSKAILVSGLIAATVMHWLAGETVLALQLLLAFGVWSALAHAMLPVKFEGWDSMDNDEQR